MQKHISQFVVFIFLLIHIYQWYFWFVYPFNESIFDLIFFNLYFFNLAAISVCVTYIVQNSFGSSYYLSAFLLVLITQILLIVLSFILPVYHQFIGKSWKEQLFMIYLIPIYYMISTVVETLVKK